MKKKSNTEIRNKFIREPLPWPVEKMQQLMCASIYNARDFQGHDGTGWSAAIVVSSDSQKGPVVIRTILNGDPPDYDDKVMPSKQVQGYVRKWADMVAGKARTWNK